MDKFSVSSWIIVLAKFLYTGKANPLAENGLTPVYVNHWAFHGGRDGIVISYETMSLAYLEVANLFFEGWLYISGSALASVTRQRSHIGRSDS